MIRGDIKHNKIWEDIIIVFGINSGHGTSSSAGEAADYPSARVARSVPTAYLIDFGSSDCNWQASMYPPIEVKSLMQESMIDRCARRFRMIGCSDPDL
jgi:hypothetical protein